MRTNKSWQDDFEQVFTELGDRDLTGHDVALDRAVRILEDVIQRIDDGEEPDS